MLKFIKKFIKTFKSLNCSGTIIQREETKDINLTDKYFRPLVLGDLSIDVTQRVFQKTSMDFATRERSAAMDSALGGMKLNFSYNLNTLNQLQLIYFAEQSFIGFQACAILAQHWLINRACVMPAEDALVKEYEITNNEGEEIDIEVRNRIIELDEKKYKIFKNLVEFASMNRIFGIRIAVFIVESSDPLYYEKPFNIDGISPKSYRGISQIDPTWVMPVLDELSVSDPMAINFYEPTFWQVMGKKIHRSHMCIARMDTVADILKPTYFFAGISIPQKIYGRVFCAEKTADEAPKLALTKRSKAIHVDMEKAISNQEDFDARLSYAARVQNNYGCHMLGLDEKLEYHDTSLADFDATILTQYQLVSGASGVPLTKLLGTSPKGWNTVGKHEENNYHELLKGIQKHQYSSLLERHYQLVIKSDLMPEFGVDEFMVKINWKSLDNTTAKEQAEINRLKAETGGKLMEAGVIDAQEERLRIIKDADSGYNDLSEELPVNDDLDLEENETDEISQEK
jgi:phage-related protein (TIGR01555 family)